MAVGAGVGVGVGAGGARMWALATRAWGSGAELTAARVPTRRARDQLLVRVHAAGVVPLDLALMEGYGSQLLGLMRSLQSAARLEPDSAGEGDGLPLIPGRELIGEVVCSGSGSRLRRGARVWASVPPHESGTHAQYVLLRDAWAAPAPRDASLSAGGVLFGALSAAGALRSAALWPAQGAGARGAARGRRVLLLGSGAVASSALQLLRYLAADVTVSCSPRGADRALRLGASCVLDRTAPDYEQALRSAGPWDAALDCAGLGLDAAAALCGTNSKRVVSLTTPLLRVSDTVGQRVGVLSGAGAGVLAACVNAVRASCTHRPALCLPALYQPCADTTRLLTELADTREWEMDPVVRIDWWRGASAYETARVGPAAGDTDARGTGDGDTGTGDGDNGTGGTGAGGTSDPAMRTACKVLIDFTSTPPAGHAAAAAP